MTDREQIRRELEQMAGVDETLTLLAVVARDYPALLAELEQAEREIDSVTTDLIKAAAVQADRAEQAERELDEALEALVWISEYPNREIPGTEEAVALAEYARAVLAVWEQAQK